MGGGSEDTTLVLMDFVMSSHLFPVPLPRPQCANPKRRRGSLNLATSVRPAPLHVSESFSHNGRGSHPELSASLFPISFPRQTKAGGGDAFRVRGGEKPPERTEMFLLTLTLHPPLSPCHTTKGRDAQKAPPVGRSQSVTDHLRVYYNLVTQTRSEAVRP